MNETPLRPTAKARILIVDDQPANIRVMAEALRDQYELYFATSGDKALEIAAGGEIELVLLDVVMPGLDGFEVCRRLKANEKTNAIPVIFVTARGEVNDEAQGFTVGGVDYITKPIRPPIVKARVRTQLELKQARDLLEELASIDPLTGICNRRRFDVHLQNEWKRAVRTGSTFSLAIADVDHFKNYNDLYGHTAGDDCLRTVAQALLAVARRPSDVVARYGGEEFGIILPETDSSAMATLMKALQETVLSLNVLHEGSPEQRVSLSVGAVTLVPTATLDAIEVLRRADRLLYQAKGNGRNQTIHLDLTTGITERLAS